jgi:predicted nucleotidyltransferase component of viral defense system
VRGFPASPEGQSESPTAHYLSYIRRWGVSRADETTDELIQLYALEGFLDRLSKSRFAENFVLKGGVLLAAFDARRPTRDIDFAMGRNQLRQG